MTDGAETLQNMLVIYTVFLAFPKCLAQLQSFSIEMVVYPTASVMVCCEQDFLLQHQWLQQHAIAVLHYPGLNFDDASPKTLYIITPLLNSQSLRSLAIHSGADVILVMCIVRLSQ